MIASIPWVQLDESSGEVNFMPVSLHEGITQAALSALAVGATLFVAWLAVKVIFRMVSGSVGGVGGASGSGPGGRSGDPTDWGWCGSDRDEDGGVHISGVTSSGELISFGPFDSHEEADDFSWRNTVDEVGEYLHGPFDQRQ